MKKNLFRGCLAATVLALTLAATPSASAISYGSDPNGRPNLWAQIVALLTGMQTDDGCHTDPNGACGR